MPEYDFSYFGCVKSDPSNISETADNFDCPKVVGLHHVRIPVSDPMGSSDWLATTFGFETVLITEDEDVVTGTVVRHPSGLFVGLHLDIVRAEALNEFAVIGLAVFDIEAWPPYLDAMGTPHTGIIDGHLGKCFTAYSPDRISVELHTPVQVSAEDA